MILFNRRLYGVFRKEAIHIRRDPRTLFVSLMFPLVMMLLYGYGIRFDVRHLPVMALDLDRSAFSRELIGAVSRTEAFSYRGAAMDYGELEEAVVGGRARVGVIIPPGAGRRLTRGETIPIQVVIDGSDATTANIAMGYLSALGRKVSSGLAVSATAQPFVPPLQPRVRVWYNPDLKSAHFVVPGIIAVIMILLGTLLTAFAIVEEKERGTMEMIIVSPVTRFELMLGKILPYLALSLLAIALIVVMGYLLFRVPIKGSLLALAGSCLVYLFAVLGLGIMVSTFARRLQDAMFLAFIVSLLPGILLSGFAFPIESLPAAIKPLTYLVPTRYFLIIIRGIYLKGLGPLALWRQTLPLLLYGLILIIISSLKFKKSLD
jgi:ABC-2 type transport system permease protein